jgi:hypothetical protein
LGRSIKKIKIFNLKIKNMKKYFIKQEIMCGEIYHMIYVRWFGLFESFYERWNTYETATIRLNELNNS